MATFRRLTKTVEALLASANWRERLSELDDLPGEKLVGPLFSLLMNRRPEIGWRAVAAFGRVVSRLADSRMEAARVVMRRMLWMLNEESGNIAWRVPEALGEILASHAGLAAEYSRILTSYVHETECDGNFLDLCELRRGAFFGLARLAQVRPELAAPAWPDLVKGLTDADPETRGLSALAVRRLLATGAVSADPPSGLAALAEDQTLVPFWDGNALGAVSLADLATRIA